MRGKRKRCKVKGYTLIYVGQIASQWCPKTNTSLLIVGGELRVNNVRAVEQISNEVRRIRKNVY